MSTAPEQVLTEGGVAEVTLTATPRTRPAAITVLKLYRQYGPQKKLTRISGNPSLNASLKQILIDDEYFWVPPTGSSWSIPLRVGVTSELQSVAHLFTVNVK